MQNLMFYAAILAVLTSLLFSGDPTKERRVETVLLLLIPTMFPFDVHLLDQLKRERDCEKIQLNAVDFLTNRSPNDDKWYSVPNPAFFGQLVNASNIDKVHLRKIEEAVHPEFPQFIYYFVPWFAVYLFGTRKFRVKDHSQEL